MQGKDLKLSLGFSHEVVYRDAQGHHPRGADADRSRHHRRRQAAGWPGGRRYPRLASRRSPTRARACGTWASTSPAKKARRSKERTDAHQPQGCRPPQGSCPQGAQGRANGRPRLSVYRSDKNIYAQIIDDATGRTHRCCFDARQGRQGLGQERLDLRGSCRHRQADRRARSGGQGRRGHLRSRRLPLSRPRQGPGGCCP